jgi:aminoglycoside phosphotransferase (APT) family kinase protein
VARFEALSGRPVRDLEWYETLAMVRSTAVMTRISVLRRDAGQPLMLPLEDNPILDLLGERLT